MKRDRAVLLLILLATAIVLCLLAWASCSVGWGYFHPPTELSTPTRFLALSPTPALLTTPTSTLFPSPRPTWAQTPLPTPEPTRPPTPEPTPTFPTEAAVPEGWLPLPADLYFIRDGTLWRWAMEGNLHPVVRAPYPEGASIPRRARQMPGAPPLPIGVTAYRLTPDGRYLLYTFIRPAGSPQYESDLVVLDQVTDATFPLTTFDLPASHLLTPTMDIVPDGRYVIFLARNFRPGTLPHSPLPDAPPDAYGTVFAVEVQNLNHEFELGYCTTRWERWWGVEVTLPCQGFLLSSDGGRIVIADGRGLWITDVPDGRPRLLVTHRRDHVTWHPRRWSPSGKYLLVEEKGYEMADFAVMDVETGEVQEVPGTLRHVGYAEAVWTRAGDVLLVGSTDFEKGMLRRVLVTDVLQEQMILSGNDVRPFAPHEVPGGRIGFAHQPDARQEGMEPGVYTVREDGGGLRFVAPLPASSSWPPGRLLWSPDGAAFLYLTRDGRPLLLGLTDGSVLWDVREVLAGAHAFRWNEGW